MRLLLRAKAGNNEKLFLTLMQKKINSLQMDGKKRFTDGCIEISVDQSLVYSDISYLIEIDSGNMAKLSVGQYILIQPVVQKRQEKCSLPCGSYLQ